MDTRIGIGPYRLYIAFNKVAEVDGVDSRVDERLDMHFLMWDFDNTPYDKVLEALAAVQYVHLLSDIMILSTGKPGGYHAYCFTARPWVEARSIIAGTEHVDDKYVAVGLARHYFTLRISEPDKHRFSVAGCLPGVTPSNMSVDDINMFSKYFKVMREKTPEEI